MLSPVAADHVQRPRNQGPLENATHYGVSGSPGDGPYVEIWLDVQGGTIARAGYRTPGCPSSTAAASMTCQLAIGKATDWPSQLTSNDLMMILGGLPEGKGDYARMAVEALQHACEQNRVSQETQPDSTGTQR